MKQLIVLSTFIAFLTACGSADKKTSEAAVTTAQPTEASEAAAPAEITTVQWLDSSQNFGKVTDGEKVM
ncbi:MAG TPA: hypothetical protein VK173_00615, partial [Lacibacter sp.]|nr:hypothetical protein [Lacibacter sp.]